MAKIKIDGKEYDTDALSAEAKSNLSALQFTEIEIQRTQGILAALQTARIGYANALKVALDKEPEAKPEEKSYSLSSGSLKF